MPAQLVTLPLKNAPQDFVEVVPLLSSDQFLSPMNGWATRDVAAHLVGSNGLMIEASQSILAGKPPAHYADTTNDSSKFDAGFTANHWYPG